MKRILLLILLIPALANADWLSDYSYRKRISISGSHVSSGLSNFPLLVKVVSDTDIGSHISDTSTCNDLRFTSDDGSTLLNYEHEGCTVSGSAATGTFWVQVPTINSGSDTSIYIYYGNSSDAGYDWTVNDIPRRSQLTWESGFKAVYHMSDTNLYDATQNNNQATNSGSTSTTGVIGNGLHMASGGHIWLTSLSGFPSGDNPSSAVVWIKTSASPPQGVFEYGNTGSYLLRSITITSNGYLSWSGYYNDYNSTAVVNDGAWHRVGWVYGGSRALSLWVDGTEYSTTLSQNCNTDVSYGNIGADSHDQWYFSGYMDEAQIYAGALNSSWMTFDYYNQSSGEISFDSEEQTSAITISVSSDTNPANGGLGVQPSTVTFTATLSATDAGGDINFYDGGDYLDRCAPTSGTCNVQTSSLTAGIHAITAQYSGDGTYAPATSDALTQTIYGGNGVRDDAGNHQLILFAGGLQCMACPFNASPILATVPVYADNASAVAGGLAVGQMYRSGNDPDTLSVVH